MAYLIGALSPNVAVVRRRRRRHAPGDAHTCAAIRRHEELRRLLRRRHLRLRGGHSKTCAQDPGLRTSRGAVARPSSRRVSRPACAFTAATKINRGRLAAGDHLQLLQRERMRVALLPSGEFFVRWPRRRLRLRPSRSPCRRRPRRRRRRSGRRWPTVPSRSAGHYGAVSHPRRCCRHERPTPRLDDAKQPGPSCVFPGARRNRPKNSGRGVGDHDGSHRGARSCSAADRLARRLTAPSSRTGSVDLQAWPGERAADARRRRSSWPPPRDICCAYYSRDADTPAVWPG